MKSLYTIVNERKTIQVKRKYGIHASTQVGANAPVRQKILGFLAEQGTCCKADLMQYIKSANEDSGRKTNPQWLKKNAKYLVTFEENGETHYKLSKLGQRVIKATTINEEFIEIMDFKGNDYKKVIKAYEQWYKATAENAPTDSEDLEDYLGYDSLEEAASVAKGEVLNNLLSELNKIDGSKSTIKDLL